MNTTTIFLSSALALLLASPLSEAAPTNGCKGSATSGCQCSVVFPGPSAVHCGGASTFSRFMAILEDFLLEDCEVADSCGQITPVSSPDSSYDFIVVGGGSAGSVVASRLSEVFEWKVLLIEAGGNEPVGSQVPSFYGNYQNSSIDWQYLTEPQEMACLGNLDRRCYWQRGKVIGGTGVLHGMMYMRGNKRDYDKWEAQGNSGWSYDDVLPYFLKSEDNLQIDEVDEGYHSVGGYLPVSRFPHHPKITEDFLVGARELGQRVGDLNGATQEGFTIAQTNSRNGVRYSSAHAFLRPVQNRTNLHIMLNTTLLRVLINPEDKQTYGVEVLTSEGEIKQILSNKEVIVSGGAVNSPQILLLSGVGDEDELKNVNVSVVHNLPGVGKNLHNHVSFQLQFYVNETSRNDMNWASAMDYMMNKDGPLTSTGLAQLTGFYKTKYVNQSEDNPDIQYYFAGYLANCAETGDLEELTGDSSRKVISIYPAAIQAKSAGYLTLANNDPFSHPRIFANYLTNYSDVETLIEGINFALNLTNSDALAKYNLEFVNTSIAGCENETFGSDAYWECAIRHNTGPENHQGGSCKMGPASDPWAVVDAELKVHGVRGLRVIDASIMPKVTSGNINAPIVMIAEKGSDMVKEFWSHSSVTTTTSVSGQNLSTNKVNVSTTTTSATQQSSTIIYIPSSTLLSTTLSA